MAISKYKVRGQLDRILRRKCEPLAQLKLIDADLADEYLQGYYSLSKNSKIMRLGK